MLGLRLQTVQGVILRNMTWSIEEHCFGVKNERLEFWHPITVLMPSGWTSVNIRSVKIGFSSTLVIFPFFHFSIFPWHLEATLRTSRWALRTTRSRWGVPQELGTVTLESTPSVARRNVEKVGESGRKWRKWRQLQWVVVKPRGVYNGAITLAPFVTRSDRKCMRLLTNVAGNAYSFIIFYLCSLSECLRWAKASTTLHPVWEQRAGRLQVCRLQRLS